MKTRTLSALAVLSILAAPLAAQDAGKVPEFAERAIRSDFVLLGEVEALKTVGEDVDPEAEVIVKTYRATVKPISVHKGTLRSPSIEVEYTKRIGVRTPHPEVTVRKGLKYAFFLQGTGKPGVFRVYDPYWGATRLFTFTAEEVVQAAEATAGQGRAAGVEPETELAAGPPVQPKREEPARTEEPRKEAPTAGPPAAEEKVEVAAVDGFRARLDGPTFAFLLAPEARLWLAVENASSEPRSVYAGDLSGFVHVEVRPVDAGEATVRPAAAARSEIEPALFTMLGPGEILYLPLDVGRLFELPTGRYRVRAVLEFPAQDLPGVAAKAWSGRLVTEPVVLAIGVRGEDPGRRADDRSFVRPGKCTEVHTAPFELGICARCGRATSSRARAICQQCGHELGVCPFCLKKR